MAICSIIKFPMPISAYTEQDFRTLNTFFRSAQLTKLQHLEKTSGFIMATGLPNSQRSAWPDVARWSKVAAPRVDARFNSGDRAAEQRAQCLVTWPLKKNEKVA